MQPSLNQFLQQAARTTQSCYSLLKTALSNCSQAARARVAMPTKAIGLVLSLALVFQLLIPATPVYAQVLTPRQVVEYALTLEKLEDDFYERAVEAFSSSLASLPDAAKAAIMSYGEDEDNHAMVLSAVLEQLGGNPDAIKIPANPNYNAILGRNPFAKPRDFLLALQYVEDLGVAAYKGQVLNLQAAGKAGKTVLAGALEIHTIEARHAAGVRYLRQTFYNAKTIRPWIQDVKEVIYNENTRSNIPVPFDDVAFDGFATQNEVLKLVGPILTP